MSITDFRSGFHVPFIDREIASQTAEGAYPFPITLNGRGYVMDLAKYERGTLAQFRQQSDITREPGEQSLSVEGVWKRTGISAYMGAGQEFYDDDESDRRRFWRSKGIDVWTRRQVCLLPDTELVRGSGAIFQECLRVGGWFVHATTDAIHASTDPRNGGFVDQALGATGLFSVTSDGEKVYAACGPGGVRQVTIGSPGGSVLVTGGAFPAELVVYANGWLVGGQANVLKVIGAGGVLTDLYTHRLDSFVFVAGASSPNGIYFAGNTGDRGEIYRTTVDDTGASLQTPVFAGDVPAGETIYALSYYSGIMLIGTSRGLRIASVRGDGGLDVGAVIEDPSGQGCRCFEARGQYAWFGAVNPYDDERRGLGRADLARFTEVSVPAYAADLSTPITSGRTVSAGTWVEDADEYRLFCVSGSGLWAQRDELVDEGTIDIGFLGQGSPESKTLQTMSVSHDALAGTVRMDVTSESGNTVEATSEIQGTFVSDEFARSISGERLDLALTLSRSQDDETTGPCLRRWTIRVVPAPASVDEIIVPLLMGDVVVDATTEAKKRYDPYEEFYRLKQLESARTVITYREGQASYDVTIREVRIQGAIDWSAKRRFFNATINVRLVTLEGVPPRLGGL